MMAKDVLSQEEVSALQKKFLDFDKKIASGDKALGLLKLDPSLFAYFFFVIIWMSRLKCIRIRTWC